MAGAAKEEPVPLIVAPVASRPLLVINGFAPAPLVEYVDRPELGGLVAGTVADVVLVELGVDVMGAADAAVTPATSRTATPKADAPARIHIPLGERLRRLGLTTFMCDISFSLGD
jgi:hypothetical protein